MAGIPVYVITEYREYEGDNILFGSTNLLDVQDYFDAAIKSGDYAPTEYRFLHLSKWNGAESVLVRSFPH